MFRITRSRNHAADGQPEHAPDELPVRGVRAGRGARINEKIEVVHTPKHGSWQNMAKCELSVMEQPCLSDRIGDEATLCGRVRSWEDDRAQRGKKIDWQFATADARIKLR